MGEKDEKRRGGEEGRGKKRKEGGDMIIINFILRNPSLLA